jgi:tricorn protease
MWVGDKIYFLSDRSGPTTLFSYDVPTGTVKQLVTNDGFDLKSASAGPGAIVYEQFGSLHLYDLATGRERAVPVRIAADLPQTRPHFEKVGDKQILHAALSPTGARALFEARGEILTGPREGDIRTTRARRRRTRPRLVARRQLIAYFPTNRASGAATRDQTGSDGAQNRPGSPPSFFYDLTCLPTAEDRLHRQTAQHLVSRHRSGEACEGRYRPARHAAAPLILCGRPTAAARLTKQLVNNLRAVFVFSLETATATQFTDGMSDALYPALTPTASPSTSPPAPTWLTSGWLDMSSQRIRSRAALYRRPHQGRPSHSARER